MKLTIQPDRVILGWLSSGTDAKTGVALQAITEIDAARVSPGAVLAWVKVTLASFCGSGAFGVRGRAG
jgi:hypothetical protein